MLQCFLPSLRIQPVQAAYWPGTEGLDCGLRGYQFGATEPGLYPRKYYGTEEPFPTDGNPYYRWQQQPVDIYNPIIKKDKQVPVINWRHMVLAAERQTPVRDELSAGRKIEYWVPNGTDTEGHARMIKVVGTVVPWVFNIQVWLVPSASDRSYWPEFMDGEALWWGLGTKKWDRAYSDPDNWWKMSYAGYSIPLCVYIEEYDNNPWTKDDQQTQRMPEQSWVIECAQLSPSEGGRTVTLYSDPEGGGSLDDLWYQGGMDTQAINGALQALNNSVAGDPRPDSRFANHCYFRVTFNMFKPKQESDFWGNTWYWYPSVFYRLRVYYLELGEFVYVQTGEDLPWWDIRTWGAIFVPFSDFWGSLLGALNPFAVFGPWGGFVAFLFTLGIVAVVILVLISIFAPWLLPRIFKGAGQARDFAYESWEKRPKGKKKR